MKLGFVSIFNGEEQEDLQSSTQNLSTCDCDSCDAGCDSGCDSGCDAGCDVGCDAGGEG